MRRFQVGALPHAGATVALDPREAHHLLRVLRASPGDEVMLFDGRGSQARARLLDGAALELLDDPTPQRPAAALHLVLAVAKASAMDEAVRMATEAGMTALHPVIAVRSVARGDRIERWERIAAAASRQCGRADVPTIHPIDHLATVLRRLPGDRRIAMPGGPERARASGPAAVLVGPEGGWAPAEIDLALDAGCVPAGFSPWVLRVDTAAAIAVAATAPAA